MKATCHARPGFVKQIDHVVGVLRRQLNSKQVGSFCKIFVSAWMLDSPLGMLLWGPLCPRLCVTLLCRIAPSVRADSDRLGSTWCGEHFRECRPSRPRKSPCRRFGWVSGAADSAVMDHLTKVQEAVWRLRRGER